MSYSYGKSIVTDGLVFYVDAANENSYPGTGTTWTDLIGSDQTTLTNGPTYNSGNGGYIELDGTNDFVDTSFNATSYFPLTICAWVKISDTSGVEIIVDQSTGTSGLGFRTSGSNVQSFWYASGVTNLQTSITGYTADQWSYMCVVYDTNSSKGYLNGSLASSPAINLTSATATNDTTNNMHIGSFNDSSGGYLNGDVAQVKIYNKALTADEILQNYNALKNRFV